MWKAIEGYYYPYRINEDGVVQSCGSGTWRTIKPYMTQRRVYSVQLKCADGKYRCVALTRLMADAFMGGYHDGFSVVHKDRCATNPALSNLQFIKRGTEAQWRYYIKRKPVVKLDRNGEVVAFYRSAGEAAKANYISENSVRQRCLNNIKKPFSLDGYNYQYEK